jgi:hypothetical protein
MGPAGDSSDGVSEYYEMRWQNRFRRKQFSPRPNQKGMVRVPQFELGAYFMTSFQANLERFESLATECELIARREVDGGKRELYLRLSERYRAQAADVRALIATFDSAA